MRRSGLSVPYPKARSALSPSTFIGLVDQTLENPKPDTYYLVVYEQSTVPQGGNYGLAASDNETYKIVSEYLSHSI